MDGNEYSYNNLIELIASRSSPFKLNSLTDVEVSGAKNRETLIYDGINEVWIPRPAISTIVDPSEQNGYIFANGEEYQVYDDSVLQSMKHSHINKVDLDRMSVVNGALCIDGVPYIPFAPYDDSELQSASHTHANKTDLDKLTVTNGDLMIGGVKYMPFQPYDDTELQNAKHTHTNKTVLDQVTSDVINVTGALKTATEAPTVEQDGYVITYDAVTGEFLLKPKPTSGSSGSESYMSPVAGGNVSYLDFTWVTTNIAQ